MTTDLDVDELVAAARRDCGFDDFGDGSFFPALEVLVESINTESVLTPDAHERERRGIIATLITRLRMEAFIQRNPEILDQEIVAPVIIVGLQRTGTSKLFRVIGSDPQWNVLLTWQGLSPVPLLDDLPPGTPDPRIALAEEWVARLQATGMQQAHALDARAPEMEFLLLSKSFMTHSPGLLAPSHQEWCESADYRPAYLYLRKQLQFLQWQNENPTGRRWILKTPFHLHNLNALVGAFPDATLVMTHRHPKTSTASMLRIVEIQQEATAVAVDRELIARLWLRNLSLSLRRFVEFRHSHPDPRIVDIGFSEVVNDVTGAVRRIYDVADAPFTSGTYAAIEDWERENVQHKDGRFIYRLDDYGLTDADIEAAFHEYIDEYRSCFESSYSTRD